MTVKFIPNDKGNPPGKLADAELHFSGGPLDGLKLIGFGIWERKNGGRNVTFPARQYTVNGERRSFALLRTIVESQGPMGRDISQVPRFRCTASRTSCTTSSTSLGGAPNWSQRLRAIERR